jgi:hypothetical protein
VSSTRLAFPALTFVLLLGWGETAIAQGPTVAPPIAAPGVVQLYEATENMKIVTRRQPTRAAVSELIGVTGKADTNPLCNDNLLADAATQIAELQAVYPLIIPLDPSTVSQCTVYATGIDNVNLGSGVGALQGTVTVVVQGDNPVDAPEFVVLHATFNGTIDFRPLAAAGYGTATGTLALPQRVRVPFTGTFRIPLGTPSQAYYVNLSGGGPIYVPVQPGEYAGGWPMVRFDLQLEGP